MRVFVAGHHGLVGSSIIRNAPSEATIFTASRDELDLQDATLTQRYFEKTKPNTVILAAARVGGIGANSTYHKEFLFENLQLQNSVMMGALKANVENFIFLGSSCIYPRITKQPISESQILQGSLESTNEGYAIAKIAGIRLAKAIFDQDGLNFFSLMPTNLYGPGDNFDLFSSHVPAALMRRFHEAKQSGQEEVTVWGSGTPRREFMHVDDMARACWFMLNQQVGGELINIGTGQDVTIKEFAEIMSRTVGFKGRIVYDLSKPDGTPQKLLDVSKAHALGWHHNIELQEGLQNTYTWFLENLSKGHVRGY